ncbi:unnamed protein product [Ophioblennius macclurei]
MAVPVELCLLENFPSTMNQMDVLMLKCHWNLIFKTPDEPPTLLFTPSGSGRAAVLLRVHPLAAEEAAGCGADEPGSAARVRLFASRLLARHHGASSKGTVRALQPVDLQRVVVGSRGGAEQPVSGLLQFCGPGRWLLGRQGEPLLLGGDPGQELLVLECSPVTQGRITADTSLVLTDCSDCANPPALPPLCRLLRLCVSDFAQDLDGLGRGCSLLDGGRGGSLQRVDCRVEVRVVDARRWSGGLREEAVDVDNCVFMSKLLLLKLGLFDREWVRLGGPSEACKGSTAQVDVKERPASIRMVDLGPELEVHDDAAFISNTLWFNLTEGEMIPVKSCTLRMKRWNQLPGRSGGQRSDSFCRSVSPSYASELHIQPVVSPLYNHLSCTDRLLADYFSTARLVSQGDILTVAAGSLPDLLEENSEAKYRCPVRFFRVEKVCPSAGTGGGGGGGAGAHLVDTHHTSLYSGGSTSSRVPCCCPEGTCPSAVLSAVGLNKPVELISSIITPHLQHSSSLSSCTILLHGPLGSWKTTMVRAASCRLNLHLMKVECVSVCADTPAATESRLKRVFERASTLKPCILLLRNLQLLTHSRGAAEEEGRVQAALCLLLRSAPSSVVVVATVCRPHHLSAGMASAFVHQVALEGLSEEQRHAILLGLSRELHLGRDVSLERLSTLSAGLGPGDLRALLVEAGRAACRRLVHTSGFYVQEHLCGSGVTILHQDFISALETLQQAQSKAIGAPKIPRVHWDDVGGLHHVKKEILDTIQLPLQHPELLALGLNRTGVLLYGPPGTGKTLLAKAVATECSMTFLSVKGPELISMYVGQSEENIREVFHRACSAAPCVVFFDELDSLAPNRGHSGDSGGVMDRVVSQLLAELDALHCSAGVFVIGATNRPDLLDQSLLRPGRFDKLVYVGVNKDRVSQLQVLQAILRKFQLDPAVDLQELVNQCPTEMTGADLYALSSDAMTAAVKRKISLISHGLDTEDSPVLLTHQDFSSALETFKPSVSSQEMLRYQSIQQRVEASSH